MITQVSSLPGLIIGFAVSGVVTARDYEDNAERDAAVIWLQK